MIFLEARLAPSSPTTRLQTGLVVDVTAEE
jgi:hypothetical protein